MPPRGSDGIRSVTPSRGRPEEDLHAKHVRSPANGPEAAVLAVHAIRQGRAGVDFLGSKSWTQPNCPRPMESVNSMDVVLRGRAALLPALALGPILGAGVPCGPWHELQ
jgi:hypothetical protein